MIDKVFTDFARGHACFEKTLTDDDIAEIQLPTVRVELLRTSKHAIVPSRAHKGDVGFDVYSALDGRIYPGESVAIDTGWDVADIQLDSRLRELGFCVLMKIEQRSGLALKGVAPKGGIIDPTYRGPLRVILHNGRRTDVFKELGKYDVSVGDRIAQLVFYPVIANDVGIIEVNEKSSTERGESGFGSTGK